MNSFEPLPTDRMVDLGSDEEMINAATHGLGFVLSLAALAPLAGGWPWSGGASAWGASLYAATLVMVYAASTLSHIVQQPRMKHRLRSWDQGAIYLLIAGTYTPFIVAFLPDGLRWTVCGAVWSVALLGLYLKVVRQHRVENIRTRSYVILGWLPALPLIPHVSTECLVWMALGGCFYTIGTLILRMDGRYRYFHAVWHTLVMLGSACHYYAIRTFVPL